MICRCCCISDFRSRLPPRRSYSPEVLSHCILFLERCRVVDLRSAESMEARKERSGKMTGAMTGTSRNNGEMDRQALKGVRAGSQCGRIRQVEPRAAAQGRARRPHVLLGRGLIGRMSRSPSIGAATRSRGPPRPTVSLQAGLRSRIARPGSGRAVRAMTAARGTRGRTKG